MPIRLPKASVGVSSSTVMTSLSAAAVTVSPSLSVACSRLPRLMVMSFSSLPAA
ncbi:hypothetical protein D3C84_511740 [compost metagenome]